MNSGQRDNLQIGEKIKKLRLEKHLSMRELGEKVGVTHAHISKLESGVNSPSMDLLKKIAEYFDIDVSYFFIAEEEEERFTDNEKSLFFERDLSLENLKSKYDLIEKIDPSDEEIQEMIKYIKAYRLMKKMEGS